MRNNGREAAGRGLIALLAAGVAVGCLSGCATLPHTASGRSGAAQTLAHGPPAPHAAARKANQAGRRARSARLLPALKKTGDVLLQLILPIPSGEVPSWATRTDSDCVAHVLSQWCTQFHLQ
jgi:hypothetical protein